jgi:hypothetical protein
LSPYLSFARIHRPYIFVWDGIANSTKFVEYRVTQPTDHIVPTILLSPNQVDRRFHRVGLFGIKNCLIWGLPIGIADFFPTNRDFNVTRKCDKKLFYQIFSIFFSNALTYDRNSPDNVSEYK